MKKLACRCCLDDHGSRFARFRRILLRLLRYLNLRLHNDLRLASLATVELALVGQIVDERCRARRDEVLLRQEVWLRIEMY